MSSLSGFDSDAVGFDSISQGKRNETNSSTQTSEFGESGVGSQTSFTMEQGSMASPGELNAGDDLLKEYPPPGLNAFLRKVVPGMLEQLDQNDQEGGYNSSDSEEEEVVQAKLIQELKVNSDTAVLGGGDHQTASILSVSWSSGGSSLAAAAGQARHERWCEHEGLLRVYSARGSGDLRPQTDITDRSCVTVVAFHGSQAALLAYGTSAGEVALRCLRAPAAAAAPSACHAARRVAALHWADATVANIFLTMMIQNTGKRRGASDQILISAGADGTMNVWQVNVNLGIFENVVTYALNALTDAPPPDITCFDFIKSYPLRPCDEKLVDDIFIVGSSSGALMSCHARSATPAGGGEALDPVKTLPQPHASCVLGVAFSPHRPGVYASLSTDAELRIYRIDQLPPLKVLDLDAPVSCMSWLPNNPCTIAVGISRGKQLLRLYTTDGRRVKVDGFDGSANVTAIAVTQSGSCRIAIGDAEASLRIYEIPPLRFRLSPGDFEY